MNHIGIGMIGTGFMCKYHSWAFNAVNSAFDSLAARPALVAVADPDSALAAAAAERYGYRRWSTNWRDVIADPAVAIVDITTPNHLHKEMALAVIAAGKTVYCEKPLACRGADAVVMRDAAARAGVINMVGFNYLKNPVIAHAKQLIDSGEIGEVVHFRGSFDQEYMTDPLAPFSWRLDRAQAGYGAVADIGSHILSLAHYLVGDVAEVCGRLRTVIPERPVAATPAMLGRAAPLSGEYRQVTVDDMAQALLTFANGATGSVEASWASSGRVWWLSFELIGSKGGLFFTQERMNELHVCRHKDGVGGRGYRTVYPSPDHAWHGELVPIAGPAHGYAETKLIEVHDLLTAVAAQRPVFPDFDHGARVARVVDAIAESANTRGWVKL